MLEFLYLHLWFFIGFKCIVNWQRVFCCAQTVQIQMCYCVCACVCVCVQKMLTIYTRDCIVCVCVYVGVHEKCKHMLQWLHFLKWFMYIHLLFRHSHSILCVCVCVSPRNVSYNLCLVFAFFSINDTFRASLNFVKFIHVQYWRFFVSQLSFILFSLLLWTKMFQDTHWSLLKGLWINFWENNKTYFWRRSRSFFKCECSF